jgi:uncharacterized protein (DUF779 family)
VKTAKSGVSVTIAVPRCRIPSSAAAWRDRSMIRDRVPGRSLMVTITNRAELSFNVTRTRVPMGKVACAAVNSF